MSVDSNQKAQHSFFMDIIFIYELKIETLIGIYEWEKKLPQTIQLDLELGVPEAGITRAGKSGNVADTIDYSEVVARIEQLFRERHFPLLETAGETIVAMLMTEFKTSWVKLSIAKLNALRNVKRLGITIERGKKN